MTVCRPKERRAETYAGLYRINVRKRRDRQTERQDQTDAITLTVFDAVAPFSDKVNNSVFHLQNQARPLHSNATICTIFGTTEHFKDCYFILINCLIQSDATWQKTKTSYSVIIDS